MNIVKSRIKNKMNNKMIKIVWIINLMIGRLDKYESN